MPEAWSGVPNAINDHLGYLSALEITQGRLAGQSSAVLQWQRRFVRGTFSRPGNAALSVAKGKGKTTLVAGVAAAVLAGPLTRARGEVVIVAASFQQARIAFEQVMAGEPEAIADLWNSDWLYCQPFDRARAHQQRLLKSGKG